MPNVLPAFIHTHLGTLRSQHPGCEWLLLFIETQHSEVWQCAAEPPSRHALPLGYAQLAQQYLPTAPISALQIERLIEVVEDTIMPLTRLWPAPSAQRTLAASAAPLPALAALLPQRVQALYSLAEVELLFNRLADAAMGSRSTGLALPATEAASLTLLRECMHHWGCHSLVLLPEQHNG